jgi:hypothetical protein
MIWLLAHSLPPPLPSVSSTSDTQKTEKESQLPDGGGGSKGRSRTIYDSKKAWSSINYSILSGYVEAPGVHSVFLRKQRIASTICGSYKTFAQSYYARVKSMLKTESILTTVLENRFYYRLIIKCK